MAELLTILNALVCGVTWYVALYFYLRHGRPQRLRHHFNQIALLLIGIGAFACAITGLRGEPLAWWEVLLRSGLAMHMAHWMWRWRTQRKGPPA